MIVLAGLLLVTAAGPAGAQEPGSPAPSVSAPPASGVPVCTIDDPQVTEVSGLVATESGFVAENDSNVQRSRVKIFFLDQRCKLVRSVSYPTNALDPEDLAVAKDGTVWVADIGDNTPLSGGSGTRRSSIALWSLPPGGNRPVIHRLVYPDAQPRDAEALLLSGDGTPVIVTKQPAGEVYVPTGPLPANNAEGMPLRRVGTFTPQNTGTPNPLGFLGVSLVTGGAVSPDGTRAVVRTMSDAYEFDVVGGDVAAAITTGTPRVTPLPNEPQGEAITYSTDGRSLLTCSDQPRTATIRRYTPAAAVPASPAPSARPSTAPAANDRRSWTQRLTLRDLTWVVAGVGGLGVVFIVVGLVAIRRSRVARRAVATAAPRRPATP